MYLFPAEHSIVLKFMVFVKQLSAYIALNLTLALINYEMIRFLFLSLQIKRG